MIGSFIKSQRSHRGWTQEDLAKRIVNENNKPLSRITITRIENGQVPSLEVLVKLSDVLDVPLSEIISNASRKEADHITVSFISDSTDNDQISWSIHTVHDLSYSCESQPYKSILDMVNHSSLKDTYSNYKNVYYHKSLMQYSLFTSTNQREYPRTLLFYDPESDKHYELSSGLNSQLQTLENSILNAENRTPNPIIEKLLNKLSSER